MNDTPPNDLTLPLEFEVACVMKNMRPLDVLQSFIDHVSFFTAFSSVYTCGYREVANTLGKYGVEHQANEPAHPFEPHNDRAQQCIKELFLLAVRKGMTEQKKRKKSNLIVSRLCRFMRSKFTTEKLYLDEDRVLTVSENLNLISGIHSTYPKDYLEYFMSQVSLSDLHARIGLRKPFDNPAMLFFEHLPFPYGNFTPLLQAVNEDGIELAEEVKQLHTKVFFVRDLDRRRAIYQEFFLNYYNKLKI